MFFVNYVVYNTRLVKSRMLRFREANNFSKKQKNT